MATEYTTQRNTAIWWVLGAIAALLVIWALMRGFGNNGAGIPNTGVDDSATSTVNNGLYNGTSTTSPTMLNQKG